MKSSMKKVHGIGVLVADALSRPLSQYPIPGKVTQVLTDTIQFLPGGGAANTGAALGQIGIPIKVFSKVGNDQNGTFIIEDLKKNGVDTGGVCVSDSDTTPFTFVGIHTDGDRTFIHTPGANLSFCLDDIDQGSLLDCDFLFYQDLWVMPGIDGASGAEILRKAQRCGVVTLLDECWGLGPNRETFETMLPFADYVLPSLDDMREIYPEKDDRWITDHLLSLNCKTVVLKMGAEGCLVCSGKETARIPSFATEIVDSTGAGDCFDAGFIAGLVHGLSDTDAAVIGSKTAAVCMQHIGGAVNIPSFETLTASRVTPN